MCHSAVEFENTSHAIAPYSAAGIDIVEIRLARRWKYLRSTKQIHCGILHALSMTGLSCTRCREASRGPSPAITMFVQPSRRVGIAWRHALHSTRLSRWPSIEPSLPPHRHVAPSANPIPSGVCTLMFRCFIERTEHFSTTRPPSPGIEVAETSVASVATSRSRPTPGMSSPRTTGKSLSVMPLPRHRVCDRLQPDQSLRHRARI